MLNQVRYNTLGNVKTKFKLIEKSTELEYYFDLFFNNNEFNNVSIANIVLVWEIQLLKDDIFGEWRNLTLIVQEDKFWRPIFSAGLLTLNVTIWALIQNGVPFRKLLKQFRLWKSESEIWPRYVYTTFCISNYACLSSLPCEQRKFEAF